MGVIAFSGQGASCGWGRERISTRRSGRICRRSRRQRGTGLKKLRARFPGRAAAGLRAPRQSLPIGFAPAERGAPVFSLVLYPRWVRFFFLEGVAIDDPEGRLEGTGSQVRLIRV